MRKVLLVILVVALLLSLAACSGGGKQYLTTANMKRVISQSESVLYENILMKGQADSYLGKTMTKEGTFTRLNCAKDGVIRYYVWGYTDATLCTGWQWEFVPSDPDSLPANGSYVEVTGTLARDEAALDKIWFADASVKVLETFDRPACDVDMTAMNNTLERIQVWHMQNTPAAFTGNTVRIYGRVNSPTSIQHPCYDNLWTQDFTTEAEVPATGTVVILVGTWQGGTIQAGRVEITKDY